MIKAVVLEIKDGHVAVLKEDGTVAKLKDKNFNIGEVVYMKEEKAAYQWRGNKVFSSIKCLNKTLIYFFCTPCPYV
jgi:hypothetical protein